MIADNTFVALVTMLIWVGVILRDDASTQTHCRYEGYWLLTTQVTGAILTSQELNPGEGSRSSAIRTYCSKAFFYTLMAVNIWMRMR